MALPINIDKLIKKEVIESERIEFKKGWNPEDTMHSICAFANDINNWGGGYIVIGIEEKEGIPILPPFGINQNSIDGMQKKIIEICNIITPSYTPIISPELYMGKHILVIRVNGGDNRPYRAPKTLGKKKIEKLYWVRKGSTTVVANKSDENRLLELANNVPFDDRLNCNASIDDLSLPTMQSFLKEIGSDLYEQSSKIPFEDLCRKMSLVRGPSEDLGILNVGLLLFCENPEKFFRGCQTDIIVYKDEVGDSFEESKFTGPIHNQLRSALSFLKSNIIKEQIIKISGVAEAKRTLNYPYEAIEESLANAFYHRSYENQNIIEVNIRLDRIEILSFPGPLPPLDKKTLKQERIVARDYRNRRIGDYLKELKLTEGRGTGFPKIRKSMRNNNSPDPIFKTDDKLSYFLTILPSNLMFVDTDLDDYKESILKFCIKERSRKEILKYVGLSNLHSNAMRHIQPLIDSGYLDYLYPHVPNTPHQKYIITDKGILKIDK